MPPEDHVHQLQRRWSNLGGGIVLYAILGAVGAFLLVLVIVLCIWNKCRLPRRTTVGGVRLMRVSNKRHGRWQNAASNAHTEPVLVDGEEAVPQYTKSSEPSQPLPSGASHDGSHDLLRASDRRLQNSTLPSYQECC
jgi:hypothetical protein